MIVLDASASIEWLLGRPEGERVASLLAEPGQSVHVPHVWGLEVAQALRRLLSAGTLTAARAAQALSDARDLPAARYPHEPMLGRVWQLRANLTAYDAAYVVLAEALGVALITTDQRLERAPGHDANVQVLS